MLKGEQFTSMSEVMGGNLGENFGMAKGVNDENPFLGLGDEAESESVSVFRVLHRAPLNQKGIRTAVNGLRADHVAVSAYRVTQKQWEHGRVWIRGLHLDGRLE